MEIWSERQSGKEVFGTHRESLCRGLWRGSHDDVGFLGKSGVGGPEHKSQLWPQGWPPLSGSPLPLPRGCPYCHRFWSLNCWQPRVRKKGGTGREESRKGKNRGESLSSTFTFLPSSCNGWGGRDFSFNLCYINLIYYMLRNEKRSFSLSRLKTFWGNKCIFLELSQWSFFYWYLSP